MIDIVCNSKDKNRTDKMTVQTTITEVTTKLVHKGEECYLSCVTCHNLVIKFYVTYVKNKKMTTNLQNIELEVFLL